MAFQLSIAISTTGDDALLLAEKHETPHGRRILLGSINEAGIHIGNPRFLDSQEYVTADPFPVDLVADDLPVLQETRIIGKGPGALQAAVVAVAASLNIGAIQHTTVDGVIELDFIAAAASNATGTPTGNNPLPFTLPTQTPATNMPAVQALMMQGSPLSVSYGLMTSPDAFGALKLVLAPCQATLHGFPAVMIGSYDPRSGAGKLSQFSALPAGIPLTPTRIPPGLVFPSSGIRIDPIALRDQIETDLTDLLGSDFDNLEHDQALSQTTGAEIYQIDVTAPKQSGNAAGVGQALSDSILPQDAPVRDLPEVTAALAKAAAANPDIAQKLKTVQGLGADVQAQLAPDIRVKKPETFFAGGWS